MNKETIDHIKCKNHFLFSLNVMLSLKLLQLLLFSLPLHLGDFDPNFILTAIISQKGSDAWWYMSIEELLPEKYRYQASSYVKGTDTMDVWFDSGNIR